MPCTDTEGTTLCCYKDEERSDKAFVFCVVWVHVSRCATKLHPEALELNKPNVNVKSKGQSLSHLHECKCMPWYVCCDTETCEEIL